MVSEEISLAIGASKDKRNEKKLGKPGIEFIAEEELPVHKISGELSRKHKAGITGADKFVQEEKVPDDWELVEESDESIPDDWELVAEDRDEEQIRKTAAGMYYTPPKTPEEIKKMSLSEKRQYIEDMKLERDYLMAKGAVKSTASALTFGGSEHVPGLKPVEGELGQPIGEFVGSAAPILGLNAVFGKGLLKVAEKSPVFVNQLKSLANLTAVGATGAAYEGIKDVVRGEDPSFEDVLEHGADWVALDFALNTFLNAGGQLGRGAARVKNMLLGEGKSASGKINSAFDAARKELGQAAKSDRVAQKAFEILEREAPQLSEKEIVAKPITKESPSRQVDAANKAFGIDVEVVPNEPITPKQILATKVDRKPIINLTEDASLLAEPYQPENLSFRAEADALADDALAHEMQVLGTRSGSEEELGLAIRKDLEEGLEAERGVYKKKYKIADEKAADIAHIPTEVAKKGAGFIERLESLETRPPDYNNVLHVVKTAMKDAGYVFDKELKQFFSQGIIPVRKTMDLAVRLNELANYSEVEPTVRKAVNSLARAAKEDVRIALKQSPEALAAFEDAERSYANTAKRYGRDSVLRARRQQAGEKISAMTKTATGLKDLQQTLSKPQMRQVEREVLERLEEMTYGRAAKQLRELKPHLSKESQSLAQRMVDRKNPHNPGLRKTEAKEGILDDLSRSFTEGSRPEKTLKLWKTAKGRRLIEETFNGSPNRKPVIEYLQKQSFNDTLASAMKKDGTLDFSKLSDMLKRPGAIEDIRALGGEEAVQFFRSLEDRVASVKRNVENLDRVPNAKMVHKAQDELRRQQSRSGGERLTSLREKTAQKGFSEKFRPTKEALAPIKQAGRDIKLAKQTAESGTHREGKSILNRMAQKDFPLISKGKKIKDLFVETMGLNPKAALSVFGLMKLGLPKTIVSLIGYKIMNKLAMSARLRNRFKAIARPHKDVTSFIIAWEAFEKELESINAEPINNPP